MSGSSQRRTLSQSRALHLLFQWAAEQLNETNITFRDLTIDVDVPINEKTVKELWKAIMFEQLGKRSTTELEKGEVDKVFETFNRHLGRHGIELSFPSAEKRSEFFEAMDMREELEKDYPVNDLGDVVF